MRIARAGAAGAAADGAAVAVEGVDKSFGDTRALVGCSLTALPGEIHAVVGENGSGKSTLVKIVSGVLGPDRGRVVVLGREVQSLGPRQLLALGVAPVFQTILLVESASIVENVFLGSDGLFRSSLPLREKVALCEPLMQRLTGHDVDPYGPVAGLPLSVKQWITIARALVQRPKLLILDESTAALDLADTAKLFEELDALRKEGSCILLITHRISELASIADRATILRDGTSVATVSHKEITEERLLELMTGAPTGHEAAETPERRPSEAGRVAGATVVVAEGVRLTEGSGPFTFELREGEIVGVTGLEGHGHAELVEILAGVRHPAVGTACTVADGTRTPIAGARAAAAQGIVYVPGDRKSEGIFPHLSILENFGLPNYERHSVARALIRYALVRKEFSAYVRSLSIRVGSGRDRITTLSGGTQQKVIIARWLAHRPRVILLNDPTRGVDISTKHDLYDVFRRTADEGKAILFLSTEVEEFEGLADRVLVFRNRSIGAELAGAEATMDRIVAALFGVRRIEEVEAPLLLAAAEKAAP